MTPEINYDLVFCVDISSTMGTKFQCIKDTVQKIIKGTAEVSPYYYSSIQIRAKIITYGDIGERVPIEQGEFYNLEDSYEQFMNCFDNLRAVGKSTLSNSLEALAVAIRDVDWTHGGLRRRHVIFIFTDKPALRLSQRVYSKIYPKDMPKNLEELGAWWEGCDSRMSSAFSWRSGRLITIAPNTYPWENIAPWNRYWPVFTDPGKPMTDVEISMLLDVYVADDL